MRDEIKKRAVTDDGLADRRNFMKLAGAGVASAGAVALSAGAVSAEVAAAKPTDAMYQETEHVKRYYELAR